MEKLLLISFNPSEADQSIGFAKALGIAFDVICLNGMPAEDLGAERVFDMELSPIPTADGLAQFMAGQTAGYSHIAAVSSMRSKDVMARLAGLIDAGMVTDVIAIESSKVFKRPILAGSIIAVVETLSEQTVLTFRPSGFPANERFGKSVMENLSSEIASKALRVSESVRGGARPDLSQAKVVVSGGRPLRDAETFERVIGSLADKLNGAVGATRAAVDSGIAPNELQVGQTGKIVAPDLYIAAGISGSTQHMAGIKDSKIIVAINKDADAPIFEMADYGLVADLYDAIPAIERELESGR